MQRRLSGEKTVSATLPPAVRPDQFYGLTIADAAEAYLKLIGRPESTRQITAALDQGSLQHKSKSLYNTVWPILNNERKRFAKFGRNWGLTAWKKSKHVSTSTSA